MSEQSRKEQVIQLLKGLETGQAPDLGYINPDKYIQHNLAAKDGLQGLKEFLAQVPPNTVKVNTVRVFQDGDHVFTHNEYDFFGPKVGFDIFRFEDGKIVEHWDNLQEIPAAPTANGHSMIDGPTEATDLDRTPQNKELVRQSVDDILVNGKLDELADYYDGDKYIQHNPQIADGLTGLSQALQFMAEHGITMRYDKIHKVLGEGSFVLVVSEGSYSEQSTSFYDLFRVENGKIAEHWDALETIPPETAWQNQNGKF
ncbi:MAG TPA: nuclear transport factor 2 family protein [Anaerolineales bacterium]|jgi:predicted SnoaL-like aldol condensation-catalyzing enzyme|nr:nuclear transport factor 2 family protein [Anaerolineales bacterium]